jgi:N-acetylmuramoyl-L-alanine amidase/putative methionine-R-sulfoxide reductase with GAF domain
MATNPSNANPLLKIQGKEGAPGSRESVSVGVPTDQREALQALLAFSTLHEQIRRKRAEDAQRQEEGHPPADNTWGYEQFVLDEVLQLVAERAQAITGADGIAIALAEGDEIVCRASVGEMSPDRGMQLDSKAGFSGACFRTGRIVRCDDSEQDPRVNVEACRRLGTRSMVAVPLLGQQNVVGLLEAFSTQPYGFTDSDVRSLNLLAELILAALKPEEEDRIERAAKVAAADLQSSKPQTLPQIPMTPPAPPATSSVPNDLPLEFSKEDIAPSLYDDSVRRRKFGPSLGVLGILAILLAGVIWWQTSPRPSKSTRESIPGESARSSAPAASPVVPANSVIAPVAPPVPTVPPSAKGSGPALVSGVHHFSENGVSTVVIDLGGPVQYRKNRLPSPDRIYFDLLDTTLAPGMNGQVVEVKDGLVNRIRVAQPTDKITRVVLETTSGSNFWDTLEQNPYRLVIEVRSPEALKPEEQTKPVLTPAPAPQQSTRVTAPTSGGEAARAHGAKLRVVIDAGHGGWDLGTVGRGGLLEKTLVLDVAQNLGKMLESRLGCDVIYTRRDDNYVSLEERAEIANHAQADLFLSVHANYSSLVSARGVETYYSSFFSPPEAREIEYRENATAVSTTLTKLSGRALKEKVDQSRKLAASVQHALYGALASQNVGIRNRGVREASFVVLTGTEMPSILAEISFVSSPTDEEKLQRAEYREQIAEALYKGVERFASTTHRVKLASNAAPGTGQ